MFLKFSYISNSAIRIRKWPCWLCPVLEPHQIWIIVTVACFVVKEADWKSYLVVILFSVCRRNSGFLDFSGFDTSKDYRLGIFWKVPLFEFVWCFLRLATLTGRTHTGPCGFSHCFQQLFPWMVVIDVGGLESVSIKVHFEHIASDLASGALSDGCVPVTAPHHSRGASLLSGPSRCSSLSVCFLCTTPGVSCFLPG